MKNSFLIQLAWADQLQPQELDAQLAKYAEDIQMHLLILQVQAEERKDSASGAPDNAYINTALARTPREALLWGMIQENWISFYQNELGWVRRLRAKLQRL